MKNITTLICLVISVGVFAQTKTIKGKIILDNRPLKDVAITVVGTKIGAVSSEDGSYSLDAAVGDVLRYSFIGLKPVEILVEDVTGILNIEMYAAINELEGVTVTNSDWRKLVEIKDREDYEANPTYLMTHDGIKDVTLAAGITKVMQKNQIHGFAPCILDIFRNIPRIVVQGQCGEWDSGVVIRDLGDILVGSPFASYDVDGVIWRQPPLFVVTSEIERIALLSKTAAMRIYGGAGMSGMVVINTVGGLKFGNGIADVPYNSALITDNVYDDESVGSNSLMVKASAYVLALRQSKTLEEAKAAYETNKKSISGSYFFVLDAFEHFMNKRNDMVFAKKIIEEGNILFQTNPVALKSLAYVYDAAEKFTESNEIYKKVFMLRPQYAQSYLDLARSYVAMGEYQKGANMMLRFDYLVAEGLLQTKDTFSNILDRELNNLLLLKGDNLVANSATKKFILEDGFEGTRIVFEWADSEAEFDLQFVNPENRYMKWEHTYNENPERILEEKKVGYSVEEYLIDEALNGIWKVNVNYKGNKKLTPTYLKATVYSNYGSKGQSQEVQVFKLQSKGSNQSLFRIQNGNLVVSK